MINIYTYDSGSPLPGVDPPTANKINGVMKDDPIPGDGLGMPVDKRTYRDMYYAHIAVMNAASIAADNTEEGATQSQFLDAVKIVANLPAYTVNSQASFNALFTRTSANVYDINASITSVVFKPGNYLVSGILSGGDTWGDIQTNNCITLKAENGTTIDFAALRGKLLVETENCLVEYVHVTGSGATVASLNRNFEVIAGGATIRNCKISNRVSSDVGGTDGFLHSGTTLQKITSKFEGCSVTACSNTVASFNGFNNCQNINNSIVHTISDVGPLVGFVECKFVNNCNVYDVTSSSSTNYPFFNCEEMSNCKAENINGAGDVLAFASCIQISSCCAENINSSGGVARGYNLCLQLSSCKVTDIESSSASVVAGFDGCKRLSSCYAELVDNTSTGAAHGFNVCAELSACKAYDIATTGAGTAYGFSTCERLSGCYAEKIDTVSTGSAGGFLNCKEITSCKAIDIDTTGADVFGFSGCVQVSGCTAEDIDTTTAAVYGFYDCDQVSGCKAIDIQSTGSASTYGFFDCESISGCFASTITNTSTGAVYGFKDCFNISSSRAISITKTGGGAGNIYGFSTCEFMSGCLADNVFAGSGDSYGYDTCRVMASCEADTITSSTGTVHWVFQCTYGAAIYMGGGTGNSSNDWMDTVDPNVTNKVSCPSLFT